MIEDHVEQVEISASIDQEGTEADMVDQFCVFLQKCFVVTHASGVPSHIIIMGAMEALSLFIAQRLDDNAPPDVAETMATDFGDMVRRARVIVAQTDADRSTRQ